MTQNTPQTPHSGPGIGDIVYVLFKHKWPILAATVLSLSGAAAYYSIAPKSYQSQAKLLVRYVVDRSAVDQVENTTASTRTN
jgi:uncharacterized protein involved in exopolysaccharide biosynthesis